MCDGHSALELLLPAHALTPAAFLSAQVRTCARAPLPAPATRPCCPSVCRFALRVASVAWLWLQGLPASVFLPGRQLPDPLPFASVGALWLAAAAFPQPFLTEALAVAWRALSSLALAALPAPAPALTLGAPGPGPGQGLEAAARARVEATCAALRVLVPAAAALSLSLPLTRPCDDA